MNRVDKKLVLLVDDDPGICQLLKLHLEDATYQVALAGNGVEALRYLYENSVDVALVDLRLGEEDGIVVMGLLRKAQPNLPVIIIAAHATTETAFQAGKKGAFAYLCKPVEAAELLEVVARAVNESETDYPQHTRQ